MESDRLIFIDKKCHEFSPLEVSKVYDKQISRHTNVPYDPSQVLSAIQQVCTQNCFLPLPHFLHPGNASSFSILLHFVTPLSHRTESIFYTITPLPHRTVSVLNTVTLCNASAT